MKKLVTLLLMLLLPLSVGAQPFASQIEAARGRLQLFTTALLPTSCAPGFAIFDTTTQTIKVCQNDGTTFTAVGGGSVAIGTTAITGGTDTRILFDNAGVVGESANARIVAGVPTFVAPVLGAATATSVGIGGAVEALTSLDIQSGDTTRSLIRTSSVNASAYTEWRAGTASAFQLMYATSSGATLFGVSTNGLFALRGLGAGLTGMLIGTDTSDPLILGTNSTTRATFGATGNFTLATPLVVTTITAAGTVPAVSNTSAVSCGTSAATIAGTDITGAITTGSVGGTSCTLTFNVAATTRRNCWCSNETTLANVCNTHYTDTTHTNVVGTFVAGDVVNYGCLTY